MTQEPKLYTEEQLGFFGFALGIVLYLVIVIIVNFFPVLRILFPVYEFPWTYIMMLVYPLALGVILSFIPYKKSKF